MNADRMRGLPFGAGLARFALVEKEAKSREKSPDSILIIVQTKFLSRKQTGSKCFWDLYLD